LCSWADIWVGKDLSVNRETLPFLRESVAVPGVRRDRRCRVFGLEK
jgi:hypothetical protein